MSANRYLGLILLGLFLLGQVNAFYESKIDVPPSCFDIVKLLEGCKDISKNDSILITKHLMKIIH